jgi:hypothetical protein
VINLKGNLNLRRFITERDLANNITQEENTDTRPQRVEYTACELAQ